MRDWKLKLYIVEHVHHLNLKPTYEGLKATAYSMFKSDKIDLKPTYEGLKEIS